MPETETAPAATNTPAATPEAPTPQVDPAKELETLRAKYERAQKDLAKFRTRAEEVEAAQKEAEEKALAEKSLAEQLEAVKSKLAEQEQAAQAAAERATAAERKAALTGKVADPDLALLALDPERHLNEDGSVNVDALLADRPVLAPTKPSVPGTPGAGGSLNTRTITNAALQEQIKNARTRSERIALQRQLQKG